MSNTINKAQKYIPILDRKYQAAVSTSILDTTEAVEYLEKANTFLVAKRTLAPLADYSRSNGFASGDVTLTWESHPINYDRGRMFSVDEADNEEAAGMAMLDLAGQFTDEYVAPELNAKRISIYATGAATANKVDVTITDSASAYAAVRADINALANAGVPVEKRVTYIDVTTKGLLDDLDSNKSRAALADLGTVIVVPDGTFATTCTLTSAGGYVLSGKTIRFITVSKDAVIQKLTFAKPKLVTPDANPDAFSWKYGFRLVGICDVYENKTNGIYVGQGAAITG